MCGVRCASCFSERVQTFPAWHKPMLQLCCVVNLQSMYAAKAWHPLSFEKFYVKRSVMKHSNGRCGRVANCSYCAEWCQFSPCYIIVGRVTWIYNCKLLCNCPKLSCPSLVSENHLGSNIFFKITKNWVGGCCALLSLPGTMEPKHSPKSANKAHLLQASSVKNK